MDFGPRVWLWDSATGRPLWAADAANLVESLAFSRDGTRLAAGWSSGNEPTRVWELEAGRGLRSLRGLAGEISKVTFSADGKYLAALSHRPLLVS